MRLERALQGLRWFGAIPQIHVLVLSPPSGAPGHGDFQSGEGCEFLEMVVKVVAVNVKVLLKLNRAHLFD